MTKALYAFVRETPYEALPAAVQRMAERCLVDLVGTAASGLATPLSRIVRQHAVRFFGAGAGTPQARLLFDGRTASPLGAALAGGMTIDSFDSHDGHVLTKGHAGCAVLPGLLAVADASERPVSGAEFLTMLAIGYEVALRAGIAQHATCPDYHTSGAWNALGVVALAARHGQFAEAPFRHALGIAEYHGPRSQMMRCIDFPTMLKDGSGWGAMVGLSAAYLAADGFTGAPALVIESDAVKELWSDLGERWRMLEMYFKPYPICRWAQPAVEASLILRRDNKVDPAAIRKVVVETFHESARLDQHRPATTEEAQYSLPFPVAAAIVRGKLSPADISGAALTDPAILDMSDRIELREADDLNARFPAERFARVQFHMSDGNVLSSATTPARGDAERPLSDAQILEKFHELADEPLGKAAADELRHLIGDLPRMPDVRPLLDRLLTAPKPAAGRVRVA